MLYYQTWPGAAGSSGNLIKLIWAVGYSPNVGQITGGMGL